MISSIGFSFQGTVPYKFPESLNLCDECLNKETFKTCIEKAQKLNLPYFILAAVRTESSESFKFKDGIQAFIHSLNQANQNDPETGNVTDEKIYYFVLPLIKFHAKNIFSKVELKESSQLKFQEIDASNLNTDQIKALIDSTNYHVMNKRTNTAQKAHIRSAQKTISHLIRSKKIDLKVVDSNNNAGHDQEVLKWLWCSSRADNDNSENYNYEARAELVLECLKQNTSDLQSEAFSILEKLQEIPEEKLTSKAKNYIALALSSLDNQHA